MENGGFACTILQATAKVERQQPSRVESYNGIDTTQRWNPIAAFLPQSWVMNLCEWRHNSNNNKYDTIVQQYEYSEFMFNISYYIIN